MKTLTLVSTFIFLVLSIQTSFAYRGVSGSVNPGVMSNQLSNQAQQQRRQQQIYRHNQQVIKYKKHHPTGY